MPTSGPGPPQLRWRRRPRRRRLQQQRRWRHRRPRTPPGDLGRQRPGTGGPRVSESPPCMEAGSGRVRRCSGRSSRIPGPRSRRRDPVKRSPGGGCSGGISRRRTAGSRRPSGRRTSGGMGTSAARRHGEEATRWARMGLGASSHTRSGGRARLGRSRRSSSEAGSNQRRRRRNSSNRREWRSFWRSSAARLRRNKAFPRAPSAEGPSNTNTRKACSAAGEPEIVAPALNWPPRREASVEGFQASREGEGRKPGGEGGPRLCRAPRRPSEFATA